MARNNPSPQASIVPLKEVAKVFGCCVVTNMYSLTYDLVDLGVDKDGDPENNGRGTGQTKLSIRFRTYNDLGADVVDTPDMLGKDFRGRLWTYLGTQVAARMREVTARGPVRLAPPKASPNFDAPATDRGGEVPAHDWRDSASAVDPIAAMPASASAASHPVSSDEAAASTAGVGETPPEPARVEPPPTFGRSKRTP